VPDHSFTAAQESFEPWPVFDSHPVPGVSYFEIFGVVLPAQVKYHQNQNHIHEKAKPALIDLSWVVAVSE